MADTTLTRKTARELAALLKTRAVSPLEILDAHLAAIERVNPKLNAIVTLAADEARKAARAAESALARGETVGPLHGLPIGIKDVTHTAGIRTTYGSPLFKDNVPTEDAEVVRRLKAAGAIVLAKTNTPEFATGANTVNELFGATRNPWNTELSPAGSSGGSAVAVATGMLPLAQGTDFGCSIRIPAAFCGVVGIRPTPGLTPNHPMPLAWDPGQVHGPLARTVEDAALMLDSMVGFSRLSPISAAPPWKSALDAVEESKDLKDLRIGYASDIAGIGVDAEIDAICRRAAESLTKCGASVDAVSFDVSQGRGPYQTWRGIWMVGQQFQRMSLLGQFGKNLKGNIEAGLKLSALDIASAEQVRLKVFHRFRELFERFDLLLTPAAPVRPYPVAMNFPTEINGRQFENYIDWIAPAFLVTLVSLPAGSVPAGKTKDGLPVGLQIIAPRFEEPRILSAAKFVQQNNPIGWPPDVENSQEAP
ncbi:MAG: amidase [Xanthobacteraceae bacterium]|nr:amidase [Xanthobacteraceae bacterium]